MEGNTIPAACCCLFTSWDAALCFCRSHLQKYPIKEKQLYFRGQAFSNPYAKVNVLNAVKRPADIHGVVEHHCTVFHDTLFDKYAAIVSFGFRKWRLNSVTAVTV